MALTDRRVEDRPVVVTDPAPASRGFYTVGNLVYALFGLLEALLAFRFFFRLLGANPASGFVNFVYTTSDPFVAPFNGIFGTPAVSSENFTAVFDLSTLIAMLVYAIIAWLIVRVLAAVAGRPAA